MGSLAAVVLGVGVPVWEVGHSVEPPPTRSGVPRPRASLFLPFRLKTCCFLLGSGVSEGWLQGLEAGPPYGDFQPIPRTHLRRHLAPSLPEPFRFSDGAGWLFPGPPPAGSWALACSARLRQVATWPSLFHAQDCCADHSCHLVFSL